MFEKYIQLKCQIAIEKTNTDTVQSKHCFRLIVFL